MKANMPNGQLPVWEEHGKMFNQSGAILRMLGKRHGFYSEEPEKMWAIDSAVDTMSDYGSKIAPLIMGKKFDPEGHKVYKEAIEGLAGYIHRTLHDHKGHFLAAADITNADFAAAALIFGVVFNDHFPHKVWSEQAQQIFNDHHNTKVYVERLREHFGAYIAGRPSAAF